MSERVRIEHSDDGVLVARKHARGTDAVERLEHESAVLVRAGHPGIVEVVGLNHPSDGEAELDTIWVGSHSLETMHCRSAAQLASLMIGATTTVADLHELGIAHGGIRASRVLVRDEGNPVLCGFGHAVELHDLDQRDRDAVVSADVEALGRMTQLLLDRDVGHEPTPDRRIRTILGPRRWPSGQVRALSAVAAAATSEDAARPSARLLSTMYRDAVPDVTVRDGSTAEPAESSPPLDHPGLLGSDQDEEPDPFERLRTGASSGPGERTWLRGRAGLALAGTVALGGIALAGLSVAGSPDGNRLDATSDSSVSSEDRPSATAPAGTLGSVPPTTALSSALPPTTALPTTAQPPATRPPVTPTADDVSLEGQHVEWGDRQWTVGNPGDRLFLGDWDCDGSATIALLRDDTGDVFVFAGWADDGEELTSVHLRTIPDAVALHPPAGDTCGPLLVETEHQRMVPVQAPATGGGSR